MDGVDSRISPVGFDREYSRRNFLKTAGWITAALSAAGVGGITLLGRDAEAQAAPYTTYQGLGDAAILSVAYQLEILEGTFYEAGANSGLFTGDALTQIASIRDNEFTHAEAIAGVLTSLGAAVPDTSALTLPSDATADAATFLGYAATFEPLGIGAYQGAAPALESKDILASAISIHNAECQHWNAIKILQGIVPPNNVAFEEALPLQTVLDAAAPFGVSA